VRTLSIKEGRQTHPITSTPFNETIPAFSPDGKWLAYQSDESGRDEVYVQPFPAGGSKTLVSVDGGTEPVWSGNGRELFYRNGDHMMTAAVTTQPVFRVSKPELLFDKRAWTFPTTRKYDERWPPLSDDHGKRAGRRCQSSQHRRELDRGVEAAGAFEIRKAGLKARLYERPERRTIRTIRTIRTPERLPEGLHNLVERRLARPRLRIRQERQRLVDDAEQVDKVLLVGF
jgi:WD40-like Beta Propeller Repeat